MERMRHWIIANGAIFDNKSTGCIFTFPVNISPLATTFNAARMIQKVVMVIPSAVYVISPKVAMATPIMTGMTAKIRFLETGLPRQIDMAMVIAGTRLRIT